MARQRRRAPSQRQLRVGEELRHALSRILARGHFRDPLLNEASITVTEVRVSPDLKHATAFVLPFGSERMAETVAALSRAAAYVRSQLGGEISLRHTPEISFQADTSFDEAARIEELLHAPKVARDLAPQDEDERDDGIDDATPGESEDNGQARQG